MSSTLMKQPNRLGSKSGTSVREKRVYFDELGKSLGIVALEEWYQVEMDRVNGTGNLFQQLRSAYPKHKWKAWLFRGSVPHGYWESASNQLEYMQWLAQVLGINSMQHWHSVTKKDFLANHGSRILQKYANSPSKLIQSVFPEHEWSQSERHRVSKGYWDDIANQKRFMEALFAKLGMDNPEQWKSVTLTTIRENGGLSLTQRYESQGVDYLLHQLFPDRMSSDEFNE